MTVNHGAAKPAPAAWHPILVLLVLLAVPVIIFWRPGFFYIIDDWTALIQMAERPFGQYLLTPDGEQWFPFFHLLYYGLVKIAGEQYSILVLINCLGTGVDAFLLYSFCRRHWEPGLALTLSLLYAISAAHHAIAWNAFYFGYLVKPGVLSGGAAHHRPVSARPLGRQALGHWGVRRLVHTVAQLPAARTPGFTPLYPYHGGKGLLESLLGRGRGSRPGASYLPSAISALPVSTPPPAAIFRYFPVCPAPPISCTSCAAPWCRPSSTCFGVITTFPSRPI